MSKKEKGFYLSKFIIISLLGIIVFFVPIKSDGQSTVIIDIIVSFLLKKCGNAFKWFVLTACLWGVIKGSVDKTYKKGVMHLIMYVARILGFFICILYILEIGPSALYDEKILPFLFNNICRSIIFLVPIGGAFLCFLTDYGLMEFAGHFLEKLVRKIWKVPGLAAVDMIASFVGSFSIGFLLTDKMYTTKKYTYKEAIIIATGFSTISTSFMITLSKNLNILDLWGLYFLTSFVVNLIVTAIVIRLWPIKFYDNKEPSPQLLCLEKRLDQKIYDKITNAPALHIALSRGFFSGIHMLGIMVPTILSIGTLGMLVVMHTKLFDVIAYVFYPFVNVFFPEETFIISKALSTTIIDSFLIVSFVVNMGKDVKIFCGIIAVTEILFLTASIPTLIATNIPVKLKDLLIIWLERIVVSIIVAGVFTKLLMFTI